MSTETVLSDLTDGVMTITLNRPDAANAVRPDDRNALIAMGPHAELLRRLAFVEQVGLGYLALDRAAASLSGGEMQRLRLSAQLGSGLTGALL